MRRSIFRRENGSTLAVALFVIVVLGMLAAALFRMRVDSSDAHVHAVMYANAELAAYSALETATYKLYPLGRHSADDPTTGTDSAVGGCIRVPEKITFSDSSFPALSRCSVKIDCQRRMAVIDRDENFGVYTTQTNYFLKAVASCSAGREGDENFYSVSKTVYSGIVDGD
jgi:MSHA biogenesis protein MshP